MGGNELNDFFIFATYKKNNNNIYGKTNHHRCYLWRRSFKRT